MTNTRIEIATRCPICGKITTISVEESDYIDFSCKGAYAQDAFPYLSVDEREMLISGICPKCWDDMFAENTEEEAV